MVMTPPWPPHCAVRNLFLAIVEACRHWTRIRQADSPDAYARPGLRPPGLEELGLVGALEERARQLSRPGEFDIQLRIADPLAPLAPGVEVAAYRSRRRP